MTTTDTTTPTAEFFEDDRQRHFTEAAGKTHISTGTRTGKEVHAAWAAGSMTHCGRWLKTSAVNMRLYVQPTCDTCNSSTAPERI